MLSIVLALLFYTIGLLLLTFASRSINSTFVAAISNFFTAIIPISIATFFWNKKILVDAKFGIIFAILAGISLAFYTIFLNRSLESSRVGIVTPIIFGGVIFLTTVLGVLLFKEKVTTLQGIGLTLIGIGILFIIYVKITTH